MMNLVGELVLARNTILQVAASAGLAELNGPAQRLHAVTSLLQDEVMRTRMQPISTAWAKIPRAVRDVALQTGKEVRVVMEGGETELDRTILEAMKDPLTHIVRNAVDHGIELPSARIAAGKPREGTLSLRAFHQGGTVSIEISDDGAGIDVEHLRRKLVSKQLMTASQASAMSDAEVLDCIFMPGFSTAERTTNLSGRGVGMDVVRSKVEGVRGTVEVKTAVGVGTTFIMRIPLTLAIVAALMVRDRGERFAIPQASVRELVHLEGDDVGRHVEYVHDVPVFRLRGRLLELVELRRIFGRGEDTLSTRTNLDIVVLSIDDRLLGLVVDATDDTQDIVVKPLGSHLAGLAAFAGVTLMGDGGLALILDMRGIAQLAGAVREGSSGKLDRSLFLTEENLADEDVSEVSSSRPQAAASACRWAPSSGSRSSPSSSSSSCAAVSSCSSPVASSRSSTASADRSAARRWAATAPRSCRSSCAVPRADRSSGCASTRSSTSSASTSPP